MRTVVVDVWGDFAMFTPPDSRVERTTYKVPTPSACRGILNAIYSKPKEFYYEILKIEVIKPGYEITVKKNELKTKADSTKMKDGCNPVIDVSVNHTQRVSTYLRNVYYRIYANIVIQPGIGGHVNENGLLCQFKRRVEHGKCFYQPCLGTRECMCHFSPPNFDLKPIEHSEILGIMLYDIFDITSNEPLNTDKKNLNLCTEVSFFNAVMDNGVIHVPSWNSNELFTRRS